MFYSQIYTVVNKLVLLISRVINEMKILWIHCRIRSSNHQSLIHILSSEVSAGAVSHTGFINMAKMLGRQKKCHNHLTFSGSGNI